MDFENALKVLACKHASSTSSTTQMADVGRQFAVVKVESKTTTAVNLPSGYGLKGQLEDELDRLKAAGVLMLKLPARKAIVDHVTSCPEIYGTSMKNKTTKKGFIVNGMLDEITELYPDIYKMMQTCKSTDVKQEYEDLLFKNFSVLYQTMKNRGDIPESLYDHLGFPSDTDYAGNHVAKPDNISCEMRHRAKILSHQLQRNLRWKKEKDALDLETTW